MTYQPKFGICSTMKLNRRLLIRTNRASSCARAVELRGNWSISESTPSA